jgi:hypothetical protein
MQLPRKKKGAVGIRELMLMHLRNTIAAVELVICHLILSFSSLLHDFACVDPFNKNIIVT